MPECKGMPLFVLDFHELLITYFIIISNGFINFLKILVMKTRFNNTPMAILVLIIGIAIVVAGILTMALYHDMSWQSYVIIGVIMLCAIWAMFNIPFSSNQEERRPARKR